MAARLAQLLQPQLNTFTWDEIRLAGTGDSQTLRLAAVANPLNFPAGSNFDVPVRQYNGVPGAPTVSGHPAFYGPANAPGGTPGLNWSTIRPNFAGSPVADTFRFVAGERYVTFDYSRQVTTFWNHDGYPGNVPYKLEIVGGVFQSRATVTLLDDAIPTSAGVANTVIGIPLVLRTTRDDDIRVRVASGFHQIANTTHVIGNHATGRVTATFESLGFNHNEVTMARLRLTEQRPGSIPATRWEFELAAPSGYIWDLSGTRVGTAIIDATLAWTALGGAAGTGQRDVYRHNSNVTELSTTQISARYRENRNVEDRSRIIINVPAGLIQPSDRGTGGSLILNNFRLVPEEPGEVVDGRDLYVNLRNTVNTVVTPGNVRVGTERDFNITLTRIADQGRTNEIPELISGRLETDITVSGGQWNGHASDEHHRAASVRFAEQIADSWWSQRNTVFTLPDGVRFLAAEIYNTNTNVTVAGLHEGTNGTSANPQNPRPFYNTGRRTGVVTVNHDSLIIHGITTGTGTAAFTLRTWLNIQADFEGDIELTLANSAFRQMADNYDVSVVIATAVSPITVETEVTDARVGFQFVSVADFSIVENVAGGLLHGEEVYVTITDQIAVDMAIAPGFTQTVTDGNIRISNPRTNTALGWTGVGTGANQRGQLQFTVERASTIPSTIEFTDVQVRIDRTVPFSNLSLVDTQGYDIHVWGPAVARNFRGLYGSSNAYPFVATGAARNERDLFPVGSISAQYVLIETPGEFAQGGDFGRYVRVTIPGTVATVDGVDRELPVATWICPQSSSAMVPIRFVSYALGLEEGAVRWDPATSTVTVDAGVRIVQFQTGNSFYVVNGVPIRMTNTAGDPVEMQIRNERSFVPFRALGEAFNIPVAWEAETATAIYNPR